LAHGYLSPEEFISSIWGWFPRTSLAEASYTISRRGELAIVRLSWSWFGPVEDVEIGSRYATGLGAQPLLSSADSVTVEFGEELPAWFDSPLPTDFGETSARWIGPLPLTGERQTLRFGVKLPQGISAQTPDEAMRKRWE